MTDASELVAQIEQMIGESNTALAAIAQAKDHIHQLSYKLLVVHGHGSSAPTNAQNQVTKALELIENAETELRPVTRVLEDWQRVL